MKKIFLLCMAGAIALTAASCGDDDGGGKFGKMTVGKRTEKIKCAFYTEEQNKATGESEFLLYLLKDDMPEFNLDLFDFAVAVQLPESLLGKTLDLTQPFNEESTSVIAAIDGNTTIDIYYDSDSISVEDSGSSEENPTVTAGTLVMTRSGNDFTVKFSVTLSTGTTVSADWKGTAKKHIPKN